MKRRHQLLVAGLAIAVWLAFFGDKTPSTGVSRPVTRTPLSAAAELAAKTTSVPQNGVAQSAKTEDEPVILVLHPREPLVGRTLTEAKNDATLFASQTWRPPPPPPPKPPPAPPPAAPPLPFVYLGKKTEGGMWEVFMARGDKTYIVHEQSLVEGMYRIDSIKPPLLSLTYIPLSQVQTLAIGGHD